MNNYSNVTQSNMNNYSNVTQSNMNNYSNVTQSNMNYSNVTCNITIAMSHKVI